MNTLFASAALGLVAAWPASGLAWLMGKAADRLTDDPLPRAAVWNRAVALPPAMLAAMVGVSALPAETTAPVYQAAFASKAVAAAGAAVNEASVRVMAGLNGVETFGAILILGALGGLAIAGVRQVTGRRKLQRIVQEARPVSHELDLAVRAAARRLDTGRPGVKVSDQIDQPLLAGLTAPVILLPAEMVAQLDVPRLVPICAHELAHLKRGDNWRLLAEHLLGGLFWMVPHFAILRARAAAVREELSDALALDGASPGERRSYAEDLIAVLRNRAASALHPAFTGKGRKPTAMRLQAITDPRDPATFARRALLGLMSLLAVAIATTGSIALAQQGGDKASSRSIISDGKGLYVDIRSDYVRVTNAELVEGHLKPEDRQVWVYHGHVRVLGRLNSPRTQVLLNGQTPPKDFDPTTLTDGSIRELQVTHYQRDAMPSVVLNVITTSGS
jgi:beta-lactamase regulating signal transducer with metallopeptidase domain